MQRTSQDINSAAAYGANESRTDGTPTHVGFILMPDYSMIAFANADGIQPQYFLWLHQP